MTSNAKCFQKYLSVLCEHVKNNLMVNELDYELEMYCSRERTQQTTDKHEVESGDLRMTKTIDGKLKKKQ